MTIPSNRIVPWTLARSIWASVKELDHSNHAGELMHPRICDEKRIKFGNSGLVFHDNSLIKAARTGFALPCIWSFLRSPRSSIRALKYLIDVGNIHNKEWENPSFSKVLLAAALEAATTYMNYHSECEKLVRDHRFSSIGVGSMEQGVFMSISRNGTNLWELHNAEIDQSYDASLIFANDQVMCLSAVGKLDHMLASADGNIQLRGYIPLLEKFGYISRIAKRELLHSNE